MDGFIESPIRNQYEWPTVQSLLPPVSGLRVLDAACGPGPYAGWLAEQGADVIGVDASAEMVDRATDAFGNRAEFHHADLTEELAFLEPDSIDLVLSQLTLSLFESWKSVLDEFARVLRVNGDLVVSTHHPFRDYLLVRDDAFSYLPSLYGISDAPDVAVESDSTVYHDIQRYTEHGAGVDISFYRRSLEEVLSPIFERGFLLADLREPQPTDEFIAERPDASARLQRRPSEFLCFRAEYYS